MLKDGRVSSNPVAQLDRLNVRTDRRRERRALTVAEMQQLLDATVKGAIRRHMSGPERALVYRLAVETGLRSNEIRSLTASSFDLDGDEPSLKVLAAYSKHRRDDVVPLRPDTAALLRGHLKDKGSQARAFRVPESTRTARMLKADLAEARQEWIKQGGTVKEKKRRSESDFLEYCDKAGQVADFHSLRHTCGTWLAAAGVHPKTIQKIMRHSTITLTMDRYAKSFSSDESAALAKLPDLDCSPKRGGMEQAVEADQRPESVAQEAQKAASNSEFVWQSSWQLSQRFQETLVDSGGRMAEANEKEPALQVLADQAESVVLAGVGEQPPAGLGPATCGLQNRCSTN
jgi:integrase